MLNRLRRLWRCISEADSEADATAAIPPADLSRLYILRVDFPVGGEKAELIQKALAETKRKYGIDVLVMEPGMKFETFLGASGAPIGLRVEK